MRVRRSHAGGRGSERRQTDGPPGTLPVGTAEYFQGKFASSRAHLEASIALHEPGQGKNLPFIFDNSSASALSFNACNLWLLGWPDRALAPAREAVALARQLGHPFGLARALFLETALHWLRRDGTAQRERAAEVIALSETHGFPFYPSLGRMFHAAAHVAAGEPEAISDLLAGLAIGAGTGSQGGAPVLFKLLGEVYMTAGQLAEARGTLGTGLAVAAQTGQPIIDVELHRLQGEIVLSAGGALREAEVFLQQALEVARAQEAKSFELRATMSLARLLRDTGPRDKARATLADIYNWFTEGFDTADLKDAKALLDELSA